MGYDCIVISEEDETHRKEIVYAINEGKNNLEALGSLKLQKEDATLEIWDYLDNRSIFEGKVTLQEDGTIPV